jgi:NTP pyrophosphatase (non-canonical NTP hydrolase)
MSELSVAEYQRRVDAVLQTFDTPYWQPLSQFARLAEEVGEVGRVLNHKYGDKNKKPTEEPDDLAAELGDVLFGLICIANTEGIALDNAIQSAIDKLLSRDIDRYPKKAS